MSSCQKATANMNQEGKGGNAPADWRQHAQRLMHKHLRHDRRLLWSLCTVVACMVGVTMLPARADNARLDPSDMISMPLSVPQLANGSEMPELQAPAWQTVTVEPGQTLSQIFDSLGLGYTALNRIIANPEDASALRNLHPGDELSFRLHDDGSLQSMRFDRSADTRVVLSLDDEQVHEQIVQRHVERRVHAGQATINSSLFAAGADAGMSEAMVIELAEVFKYDIDFIKDIRKGDHFSVIYDDVWRDGEKLYPGHILAAEFYNRGHRYTAYRFNLPDGSFAYYDEDGRPLQRALMRTPVKFTRISSRFRLHRKHPILGYTRAHKGVDYAAPRGTPIHAAGNGRIVFRGRAHGYGNFVIIKHNKKYSTAYGHMNHFAKGEHVGSYVRQGQVIGYVGMTGLATGPHLHYEVRVRGHQVNPLTVTMPKPKPLPDSLLAKFKVSIGSRLARLKTLDSNRLAWLASRGASAASSD